MPPSVSIAAIRLSYGSGGAKSAVLSVGDSVMLSAAAVSTSGTEFVPPAPVTFISRDSRVATVSSGGEIHAVGNGVTRIVGMLTVGSNEFLDSVTVAGGNGVLANR
jgi:hypothetical protein